MKFALVDGVKRTPEPKLAGVCQGCGSAMVAKCGKVKIHHWAHAKENVCDHWWENETEWHRNWKSLYPVEWQEIVHFAENGEKHIADVKTNLDWVVEFQHSFLNPDERKSREAFYKKMIWVVDGKRRKKDQDRFADALKFGNVICNTPAFFITKVNHHRCSLITDWSESDVPVFFDFGERVKSGDQEVEVVWWLLPKDHRGNRHYLLLEPKHRLAKRLRDDATRTQDFEAILKEFSGLVKLREETEMRNQDILNRRRTRFGTVGF